MNSSCHHLVSESDAEFLRIIVENDLVVCHEGGVGFVEDEIVTLVVPKFILVSGPYHTLRCVSGVADIDDEFVLFHFNAIVQSNETSRLYFVNISGDDSITLHQHIFSCFWFLFVEDKRECVGFLECDVAVDLNAVHLCFFLSLQIELSVCASSECEILVESDDSEWIFSGSWRQTASFVVQPFLKGDGVSDSRVAGESTFCLE